MEQEVRTKRSVEEIIIEQLKQGEKKGSELLKAVKEEGWSKTNFYYHLKKLIKEGKVVKVRTDGKEGIYKLQEQEEIEEKREERRITQEAVDILKRLFEGDYKLEYKLRLFKDIFSRRDSLKNEYVRQKSKEVFEVLLNLQKAQSNYIELYEIFTEKIKQEDIDWVLDLYYIAKKLNPIEKLVKRELREYGWVSTILSSIYARIYDEKHELREEIFKEVFEWYWKLKDYETNENKSVISYLRQTFEDLLYRMTDFKDEILNHCFEKLKDEKYEDIAFKLIVGFTR